MPKEEPFRTPCVCGKPVTVTAKGTPRAHVCNAEGGPAWPDDVSPTPEQPIVPADVDETEHVHRFEYGDDGIHQAGSFCDCGAEEPGETDSPTEELLAAIDDPADIADDRELRKGPWVPAWFDGTRDCGHDVLAGDLIRADGEGGWECEECADNDEPENWNGTGRPRPSASNVKMPCAEIPCPEPGPGAPVDRLMDQLREMREHSAALGAEQMARAFSGTAMAGVNDFLSPSQSGIGSGDANDFLSAPEPQALGSATGQPETERDRYGRYLVKDPRTGDYKRSRRGTPEGFTRATTYAKALLDTYGLNQWEKRMVAVGMAKRPDLVQRAKGLDVTADKAALEEIHEAAKEAAGGSEASSAGTEFHTVTEHLDAGLLTPNTVPEEWRTMAKAYAEKMSAAGLTTRTEWIERITFTDRGGEDVTGTADRVLLERDGTPVIGDVKSGKGIDLAEREIAIQLLTYAMGVNQFGLYNKATKQWEPWTGPPVSEEYGIVMHVPVQRPNNRPAYCDLYRVSFRDVQGFDVARAMQAAAWTRRWRNAKGFATPYSPPAAAPRRTWAEAFVSVTTPEEANRLWQAAVDAGMDQGALDIHVQNARAALAALRSQ